MNKNIFGFGSSSPSRNTVPSTQHTQQRTQSPNQSAARINPNGPKR